jgi:ribulose-bisphosphate carboxylase large chain
MSTHSLGQIDPHELRWRDSLKEEDYVDVVFRVETGCDLETAAAAIACEQSMACAIDLARAMVPDAESWMVRIKEVIPLAPEPAAGNRPLNRGRIRLAFPAKACGEDLVQLLTVAIGESFRLGFLEELRVEDLIAPPSLRRLFPGPRAGVPGIRQRLGVNGRPLFCRSIRPATGQFTATIVETAKETLLGGFDMVKDDELTFSNERSPFTERVRRMVEMKREVEDATGEAKLYIANCIAGRRRALDLARRAEDAGVDGILLAPALQGMDVLTDVAEQTKLLLFCHNTFEDLLHRHPRFGVSLPCLFRLHRMSGADAVFLPGHFAEERHDESEAAALREAAQGPDGHLAPSLMVMAGGKKPAGLRSYVSCAGTTDFMLIVAAALDSHPGGVRAGARAFRDAWKEIDS